MFALLLVVSMTGQYQVCGPSGCTTVYPGGYAITPEAYTQLSRQWEPYGINQVIPRGHQSVVIGEPIYIDRRATPRVVESSPRPMQRAVQAAPRRRLFGGYRGCL